MIQEAMNANLMYGRILVYEKDSLPDGFDLNRVLRFVEKRIPPSLTQYVEQILIGQFDDLIQRQVNAAYADGAIYITNDQVNEQDMVDDIIHEFSHAVEEMFGQQIYSDGLIVREFLAKRKTLNDYLKYDGYNVPKTFIHDPEFNSHVDSFLYRVVGYPKLHTLIDGLFLSPYAVTSVNEYWGIAFEEYFSGDKRNVKLLAPAVFKAMEAISQNEKY